MEILGKDHLKRIVEFTAIPRIREKQFSGRFIILRDMTEQRMKEKNLEEANQLYQTLFMDAPIRVWEFDYSHIKKEFDQLKTQGVADFKEYFNRHPQEIAALAKSVKVNAYNKLVAKAYIGDTKNPKTNISLSKILVEDSYKRYIAELLSIAEGKTRNKFEALTQSLDGSLHYNTLNWAVLPGHEEDYARVIVSADDITERRKAELELLASETRFRLLAENADVGISYYDPEGNVIYYNHRIAEITRSKLGDYIGENVVELFGEEIGNYFFTGIEQSVESDHSLSFENPFVIKGQERWFSMIFSRVLDDQGKCIGIQVISNDITRQKELETQLLSLARFPEENPNPVMRFARSGALLYSNRGSQSILETWNFDRLKRIPAEYQTIIDKCLQEKARQSIEIEVDQRIINLVFAPVSEMGYVNIYGRDITDQKLAEIERLDYSKNLEKIIAEKTNELKQAQERLVRQERLAVMGQLAGGVGHELRNPLAVINNALYMLRLANKDPNSSINDYLNIIDQEVAAANKIITDLLTFARIKPASQNPLNLSTLLDSIFLKFVPPENIRIINEITSKIKLVYVDEKQIEQVITNLITNAYQSMPDGGNLTIKAKMTGNLLKVDFSDTGIGIPSENLGKIFEPLYTTKAKGIGLGLTISKMLTEINGGKIKVKSKSGQGASFSLFLPVYSEKQVGIRSGNKLL